MKYKISRSEVDSIAEYIIEHNGYHIAFTYDFEHAILVCTALNEYAGSGSCYEFIN